GPFLDRIDIHVRVRPVPERLLLAGGASECSADIRARVAAARDIQKVRFDGSGVTCNAAMGRAQLNEYCALDDACQDALLAAHEKHQFSARSNDKILKVARTIADLAGSETIELPHLLEAIQLHAMDAYLDP
ncbi:MAG: ATP-binding protein, partial [Clostridia bacterium]|nr:ATP-binding protein [Clostridia bacterium]